MSMVADTTGMLCGDRNESAYALLMSLFRFSSFVFELL